MTDIINYQDYYFNEDHYIKNSRRLGKSHALDYTIDYVLKKFDYKSIPSNLQNFEN